MAKKCKDCDPNKYIEGLSWRGVNGISFDGYTVYNDVGKPLSSDPSLADVSDLVDAYNPIFSSSPTTGLTPRQGVPISIKGIDRGQGFWFVWSLTQGLIMFGTPGQTLLPAIITNSATTTAQIGQPFSFNVTTSQTPSALSYSDFGVLAATGTSDRLRFSAITDVTTPLIKNTVNYVGYFTGIIVSTLNGNRYLKDRLETFVAKKSLTIKCRDSSGNDPIHVTSAPTAAAFRGQSFSYTLTTNISASQFYAELTADSLNILTNLGLSYNQNTKTISGVVSSSVGGDIKTVSLDFRISGPNADAGNRTNFSLNLLYGDLNSSAVLPTISAKTFPGEVGKAFSNSLAGLNNKHTILGISSLPEGLSFNASKNQITGTPKHAGTFYAYASCSNAKGTSSKVTLTFNFSHYEDNNSRQGNVKAEEINLPRYSYSTIRHNKISLYMYTNGDETIKFKKINRSEFPTIRKDGKPEGTISSVKTVGPIEFNLGIGEDPESCFWIAVEDPSAANNRRDQEWGIKIDGYYDVTYGSASQVDAVGNVCYAPPNDGSWSGPASKPIRQDVDLVLKNTAKASLSANPAENVPSATFSPDNLEHQVIFTGGGALERPFEGEFRKSAGSTTATIITKEDHGFSNGESIYLSVQTGSGLPTGLYTISSVTSIAFNVNTGASSTEFLTGKVTACRTQFGTTRLSKSGLLKYPNGIPKQNARTYTFTVRLTDVCSFNYVNQGFAMFYGTYNPQRGDVYSCSYQGNCFAKGTKILTPQGAKEIQDFKKGDVVYGYDKQFNLISCNVSEFTDHDKELFPIVKVKLSNGTILKTTKSHGFLTPNGDYLFLNDLKVGDEIISLNNEKVKILNLDHDGFDIVYNIEVENLHNYIAENIYVHNGAYRGPKIGTVQCGKWGCQIYTAKGWVRKGRISYNENFTLTNGNVPSNCHTLVSRVGDEYKVEKYGYRYTNSLKDTKDIGITSLTNISILDVLGEGPIEGIVDYEIKPNPGFVEGDIGYRNGVKIIPYAGEDALIRSIYWNEIPLADNTYPQNGSLNFEFIRLNFDNGRSSPRHINTDELSKLTLEEEFYSKKAQNGAYVPTFKAINATNNTTISENVKLPKRLTSTKVVGSKLFGKRVFQDKNTRTYKKSLTILNKDLYGIKLHIKGISLFKQIVDLTIWDSADDAAKNSTSGRIDRQVMTFNLYLKRIDKGSNNQGMQVTVVKTPSGADYSTLTMAGKLNQGPYIETFEWTGLNLKSNDNTIGWEIEVEPTYEESVDQNIVLKSAIDSITEIYNDFLILPSTAGILTTFDARFFSSIPQRAYDIRMLRVKVPSNYNPFSRTYDGIWNGTFKLAWTDNPAWCFYDVLTNRRYGLGRYVDPKLTDKWTLYEISRYCDQLVSDGRGGLEPRFTCNILISTREDAYKVVNDMASIFRAIVYYNAGLIFTSQDRPKDPIYIFNNSNVKDGEFTYSNTSKRVRRNVALVRYNDKENFYKPAVKYVESREGLIRFGIREIEVSAFGCTSEGQAERLGKWTLLSENLESELVSFETSLPAMYLKPGDIVFIQDQNRQNKILGGRTYELNKGFAILDIKYTDISGYLNAIKSCNFNVLTPAGNIEIGTETGNALITGEIITSPMYLDGIGLVSGISTDLIRRKQIQTISYSSDYQPLTPSDDNNVFKNFVLPETGGNYEGYTKIYFGGQNLDTKNHTLLNNTVWTLELDPDQYDYRSSPSVTGLSNLSPYPGAYLEPHIDKTQKFRILDIEEQEEFRYKVTALQYDELKYSLADDV